jgi:hypothetical protein
MSVYLKMAGGGLLLVWTFLTVCVVLAAVRFWWDEWMAERWARRTFGPQWQEMSAALERVHHEVTE